MYDHTFPHPCFQSRDIHLRKQSWGALDVKVRGKICPGSIGSRREIWEVVTAGGEGFSQHSQGSFPMNFSLLQESSESGPLYALSLGLEFSLSTDGRPGQRTAWRRPSTDVRIRRNFPLSSQHPITGP